MHDVQLKLEESGRGAFFVESGMKKVAEMVVAVREEDITVYHTEVIDELKGKGVAKQLLFTLVDYARNHHKRIIPLCTYVRGQFEKYPEQYDDVWKKDWHQHK